VIEGVSQVIVEVEDQDQALRFWTETMEFELVQDALRRGGTLDRSADARQGNHLRAATSAGRPSYAP
jgi:hypothetical protein